jgi:hypothetical protein
MQGPIKLRVTLELDEWHRLKERAIAERRDPDNMAGYLIVTGLQLPAPEADPTPDEASRELVTAPR